MVVKTGTRLNQLNSAVHEERNQNQLRIRWKQLLDEGQIVDFRDPNKKARSVKTGVLDFTVDLEGLGKEDALGGIPCKEAC